MFKPQSQHVASNVFLEARRRSYRYFAGNIVSRVERWDDVRTVFRPELCLAGGSFRPKRLFTVEPVLVSNRDIDMPDGPDDGLLTIDVPNVAYSPSGRFAYLHWLVPAGYPLELRQGRRQRGRVWFTDDVLVPALLTLHGKDAPTHGQPTATLTPSDILTRRELSLQGCGTVVLGGLGLGWLLARLCQEPLVKQIILVDEQEKIDWLLSPIYAAYGLAEHGGHKIQPVAGDIFAEISRHERRQEATLFILDVWPNYDDARQDRDLRELRRQYPDNKIIAWGSPGGGTHHAS